jgi:hypothetical protein
MQSPTQQGRIAAEDVQVQERLFLAPDGAQWLVSVRDLAGSAAIGAGLAQLMDRAQLVFDKVRDFDRRSLWVELPVDLDSVDQDQLKALFELAQPTG